MITVIGVRFYTGDPGDLWSPLARKPCSRRVSAGRRCRSDGSPARADGFCSTRRRAASTTTMRTTPGTNRSSRASWPHRGISNRPLRFGCSIRFGTRTRTVHGLATDVRVAGMGAAHSASELRVRRVSPELVLEVERRGARRDDYVSRVDRFAVPGTGHGSRYCSGRD